MSIDLTNPTTLNQLRATAQRLHRSEGIDLPSAYLDALGTAVMIAAESAALDAFEIKIVEAIRVAQKNKQGRAVRRSEVVIELDKLGYGGTDEWTVSVTMSSLACRGLVLRPSDRLWAVAA